MYRCGIETVYRYVLVAGVYGINCTVVELKRSYPTIPGHTQLGINCTVVELKRVIHMKDTVTKKY